DADGDKQKDPGEEFLAQIDAAVCEDVTLTAAWTKLVAVYVNVVIEHVAADGVSYNNDAAKHNVEFTITQLDQSAVLGGMGIAWDGENTFAVPGYSAQIVSTETPKSEQTRYTATAPTVANAIYGVDYTVSVEKSGYSVKSINRTKQANGDTVLDVTLIYDPFNFDFVYTVELDAAAKEMPAAIKPTAVHVKVTSWYDTPYDEDFGLPEDTEAMGWYTITQQRDTYSRIELGSDGTGTGTYPVWQATTGEHSVPYYYRIEIVAYEFANGTVIPVKDLAQNQPSIQDTYRTDGGAYSTVVQASDTCVDPNGTDGNLLKGAYYSEGAQVGTIKGIISIQPYDITLYPNGGAFADTSTAVKVLEDQVWMPDLSAYEPTRAGYVFAGWDWIRTDDRIAIDPVATGTLLREDLTLMAKWTPIQYTVTYVVNGGELPSGADNPKSYTITTGVEHPIPTREDHVFKGWYESQSFAGQAVDGFEPGETGDKVFYAKWEYDLAAMRITKKFAQGTPVDPEQTFIFHIVGEKTGIDLRVHVKGAGSVNINGLPRGSYTVTEETQWSWRYVPKQNQIKVELTSEGAFLVFENQRSDKSDKWINASDLKTNRFQ
ncbi:MAG: InlB B-repeat-containing protein, partial [Lachnospiraceae bacterium]|nr:InlB B-repeat-containing protein [Lachnospiraceae bacterium]